MLSNDNFATFHVLYPEIHDYLLEDVIKFENILWGESRV